MKTVRHACNNPICIDEIDDVTKYTNQIQGLARLFSSLDIETINQKEFSGARWALADTVDKLDSVVEGMMQRSMQRTGAA